MQEIPFAVPLTGILRIDGNEVTIIVNRMETSLSFPVESAAAKRTVLEEGMTLNDVVLEAAREIVAETGYRRFHAAELFHKALAKHPAIKRNSFMARVIACTPDHPSSKHFASRRDYFSRAAPGIFSLENQYLPKKVPGEVSSSDTQSMPEVNH
jgi:hypothetical protein